jgi:hypothetical protein
LPQVRKFHWKLFPAAPTWAALINDFKSMNVGLTLTEMAKGTKLQSPFTWTVVDVSAGLI